MKRVLIALYLFTLNVVAYAQAPPAPVVIITATRTVADGTLVPVLTWTSTPIGPSSCVASGGWSGTKAGAGTETLPAITRSASYALTCSWEGVTGTATVSWILPTLNTNGTPFVDLKGSRVIFGNAPGQFSRSADVVGAATSVVVDSLGAGTWSFKVRVVNSNDVESADSNVAQKTVVTTAPTATGTVALTVRPVPAPPVVTTVVVTGVQFVPLFRVGANGVSISSTFYGLAPVGIVCGAKVSTWRGRAIHRVSGVRPQWLWGTSDVTNLAAPCGSAAAAT